MNYQSPYSAINTGSGRLRQRQRRPQSSISLAFQQPAEAGNAVLLFLKRKAGSILSLTIGVLIGLFVAGLFSGGTVSRPFLLQLSRAKLTRETTGRKPVAADSTRMERTRSGRYVDSTYRSSPESSFAANSRST